MANQHTVGIRQGLALVATMAVPIPLDTVSGVFSWAGAGPSLPILLRGGKAVAMNSAQADPLGMRPQSSFPSESLRLLPGDALFLATDGLGLARSPEGIPYRDARLFAFLSARAGARRQRDMEKEGAENAAGGEALLRAVLEDAAAHAAPDGPREDVALLLLRWKGLRGKNLFAG